MKLSDLLQSIHVKALTGDTDREIDSLCFDSREAGEGSLFCALKGVDVDGHDYIPSAVEKGASAVIASKAYPADTDATWIEVGDTREAMALAAKNFYGDPSTEMPVVGITGTNGKTTTAFLTHHLMQASMHRAGLIGTIEYRVGEESYVASHTTPESVDMQRLLREMRDSDCRAAVMEVSSHGLDQHRATGVKFDAGVFTNLSQDHLDYHGTMDSYFESKKLLFEQMANDSSKKSTMVVNGDDKWGRQLLKADLPGVKQISFGLSAGCDMLASEIVSDFNGTQFKMKFRDRSYLVKIPLIGQFNAFNAMAALGAASGIGMNFREAVAHMAECPQVPGRLEVVSGNHQINYRVFVDYAHTPDALENVLKTLAGLKPNRIITVFGCGGDRDRTKRPKMAQAAQAGSQFSILTSDNPRTEDPKEILKDAESGLDSSTEYEVIEDRAEAIALAVDMAGEKDIVLIAGKGHEPYQEINGVRHHFDDREVAGACIRNRAERGGEE